MDRYHRVEKPRPEAAAISENEIRITTQGLIRNYVTYATSLVQVPSSSGSRCAVGTTCRPRPRSLHRSAWAPCVRPDLAAASGGGNNC